MRARTPMFLLDLRDALLLVVLPVGILIGGAAFAAKSVNELLQQNVSDIAQQLPR